MLVAGGGGGWPLDTATAELYDPHTGTFSATGSMSVTRVSHTATLLANGKVLIAGGEGQSYLAPAELYDPQTGSFMSTGSMLKEHRGQTATLLANGQVLITGVAGEETPLPPAELYTP